MNLKEMERYLGVNLLGPGPRLMKKGIYRSAVSQRLRDTYPEARVETRDLSLVTMTTPGPDVAQLKPDGTR